MTAQFEEACPEAAEVLRAAGWAPHDEWGVYTRWSLVMGSPRAGDFHVKNTAARADSPDTPDDPVAAARWLVARFGVAPGPEQAESGQHEDDGEIGAATEYAPNDADNGGDGSGISEEERLASTDYDPEEILDADFTEAIDLTLPDLAAALYESAPALEGADLGAEILDADQEAPAGAFIFGDNLHEKRTAAIGLVVQIALSRMPPEIDYAQLSELRNFVMGVSEGRWPDDPAKRDMLEALEANERARRSVEAVRDAKTAYLVSATREQIESFDPNEGWP